MHLYWEVVGGQLCNNGVCWGGLNNAFIDKRMIGEEEKQWDVNELKLLGIGST